MVLAAGSAQALEKGLELGVEGYSSSYFVYANQEDAGDDRNESEMKREIELNFTGEVTLDNGVSVGASVAMQQAEDDSSEDIKESYVYTEGGYGKLIMGQEYNAAYLMQVAAPAVDAEFDGMDPTYNIISVGDHSVVDGSYDMSAQGVAGHDANAPVGDKVTYISPVWNNLQVGLSYTPSQENVASRGEMSSETDEAMSAALRYSLEDFVGADWTIDGGWNKTNSNLNTINDGSTTDGDQNYEQFNVAFDAEWEAWEWGVAYYGSDYDLNDGTNQDEMAFATGVNYETGNFNYGASYLYKEAGDEDDMSRYMGGVNYSYGPGMTLNGSVAYHDYSSDDVADENSATVLAIGTVINF